MIYVWQLVLDPTRKLSYLDAAWEPEWVEAGKNRMKEIVSCLLFFFGWFLYQYLNKFLKYRAKYVPTDPTKSSQQEKSSKTSMLQFYTLSVV